MRVGELWLTDFRNYREAHVELPESGVTVVLGGNGEGKTNLLEAVGYLATLRSFRAAPADALVRDGCERAVVRAEAEREGRRVLLEAELRPTGRDRVQVNRQPLRRTRDLLGALRVTVFSPDDLVLVKGGPSERRTLLDTVLVSLHARHDQLQRDVERVVRQRNTLLKQAGGSATPEIGATLDVWDARLGELGSALAIAREELTALLEPEVGKAYDQLAHTAADVGVRYERSWTGPLEGAIRAARADDLRRGVTTVGPHRDELALSLGGLPARTHSSQGEQRCLALALRLATHQVVLQQVGDAPVLLLDDVFSELDAERSAALLAHLPAGQTLLTTASRPPTGVTPALTLRIADGKVKP